MCVPKRIKEYEKLKTYASADTDSLEAAYAVPTPVVTPAVQEYKPFRCQHCSAILAETDGVTLRMSVSCFILYTAVLCCNGCKVTRTWKPVIQKQVYDAR